jgi:L-ascorbate metabolism protein UlaG (beta-lactamase superfamily)
MDIKFHGFSCISVSGRKASVLVDPYSEEYAGLKLPKRAVDVVLANEADKTVYGLSNVDVDNSHVFDWPGEYEGKEVNVVAVHAKKPVKVLKEGEDVGKVNPEDEKVSTTLLFSFEVDGVRFAHLSNLSHKIDSTVTEQLGDIDVLFVPVGGNSVLDPKAAHSIVEDIEPRVVVPMYFNIPNSKVHLGDVSEFFKEVGISDARKETVLKIKSRSDLPSDNMEYVHLEPVLN